MLEAVGLGKSYRGKAVLRDVSLTLSLGECLGVAGHNGSGKSTLLSILAQVTPPDTGSLRYEGRDILGERRFLRRMLGYVPQQNSLLEDLTVQETLRFWQKTYGLAGADLFTPSAPATMLGLGALRKKRVSALSGGMQKRLSLAVALLHTPRILLLDEVLAALDRSYRAQLMEWLQALRKQGTAILYCSHEVSELEKLCDNILVLRDGSIVFYGPATGFPTDAAVLDEWMNTAVRC